MNRQVIVDDLEIEEFSDDGCVECNRDPRFKIEDGNKSVIFLNPEREKLCRTHVDGCVIKTGPKADWVASHEQHGFIIIEFKGHDIDKAYDQVCRTAKVWRKFKLQKHHLLAALIIANRIPKAIAQTELQRKFAKEHRGQLKLKSYEDNLSYNFKNLLRGEDESGDRISKKPSGSPAKTSKTRMAARRKRS